MRLSALNRLRVAFLGIGVLLLIPLAVLAHSVNLRLEAQRRLRHEVVADRIFDELERELTLVLSQEFARPSAAYDATSMDAVGSAPYVLGYFTSEGGQQRLLPRTSPDEERERRMHWALDQLERPGPEIAVPPATSAPPVVTPPVPTPADSATHQQKIQPAPASPRSSPEILKKLNRSDQERHDYGY